MSSTPIGPAPPAASPTAAGIPRLIYLARILWLCFFPVFTVLAGDLVLIYVAQAREALLAFNDATSQRVAFEVAYVLWMVSAWYVARLLLGKRFEPDLIGACRSPRFAQRLAVHLPRVLALVAGIPIPLVLLFKQPRLLGLTLVLFLSCAIVLVGLVFRRHLAKQRRQMWVKNWAARGGEHFEHFDGLSGSAWIFIGALFILSVGLCVAIPVGMAAVARPLGAPTLVLLALMSWTLFGGFALTYLPRSYGLPAMTWLPLVLLVAFSRLNENHPVASPTAVHNGSPEDVGETFKRWLQQRPDPKEPVIFVAAAGGASRAAYWTTSALGMLEDEARHRERPDDGPGRFAQNIFVISSVSGGSLGAAAFVATVDLTDRLGDATDCRGVQKTADHFTGQDHLSTVLGLMLFPDLLQRFLPVPVDAWDRSRGLEEVWAHDWDELLRSCGVAAAGATNPWSEALVTLAARADRSHQLPVLALNSTALAAGQQVLQAPFSLPRPDVFDVLSPKLATDSLTLAQAVHNSARFPYVSPGGVVRQKSGAVWDRLGDGAYVEASGTLMLAQIIRILIDENLIREEGEPPVCSASPAECYIRRDQIRILVLDNTPTLGDAYLCGEAEPGSDVRTALVQNQPAAGNSVWPPGPDILSPLIGAFSTREGRAVSAEVDLRTLADGCTARFAELRLPMPRGGDEQPSMNWMLNRASRDQIDQVLTNPGTRGTHPDPNALLAQNLATVRAWFSRPSSP